MLVAFCDQLLGNSTSALLERHAVAVADPRVAQLPLHRLEGVRPGRREKTLDRQRLPGRRLLRWWWCGSLSASALLLPRRRRSADAHSTLSYLGQLWSPGRRTAKTSNVEPFILEEKCDPAGLAVRSSLSQSANSSQVPDRRQLASAMQWRSETLQRGSYAHQRAAAHTRHTTISAAASAAATIAPVESFVVDAAFTTGAVFVVSVVVSSRP